MAEDVKLNISGNMSKLKGQLSKADADIKKRTQKLDQLKAKIQQTESKMAAMKSQVGGIAKGAGIGLGTAGLTLALQETMTAQGMETGGYFSQLIVGAGIGGAFGGPAAAATAAIGVTISQLAMKVGEMGQVVAKIQEGMQRTSDMGIKMLEDFEASNRAFEKAMDDQRKELQEQIDKKAGEMIYQVAMAQIAGEQ